MSTLTTIASGDLITNSRADINNNFSALNTDKMETSVLDTDTALTANSDSKVATQKAVKAYVDAGGNVNASTTGKGIVEEATDAEIVAGTDAGGTGARLFVPPSKLNTQIDAKIATAAAAQPNFFQQAIPALTFTYSGFGASSDGSAFYILQNAGNTLDRYARDSGTGFYTLTHTLNPTFTFDSPTHGIIQIGIYIYIFGDDNTNVKAVRFLAADLTGETNMTVPVVGNANNSVMAWTNGTDAYVVATDSQTTSRRWTLSGTTFSAASTATVTTGVFVNANSCSMWNGTSAYIIDNSVSPTAVRIQKLTLIDGSTRSTTDKNLDVIGGADDGAIAIPISSTLMYVGKISNNFNATVDVSSTIHLFPITAP